MVANDKIPVAPAPRVKHSAAKSAGARSTGARSTGARITGAKGSRAKATSAELATHLLADADRPEHRYLGTPLLELLTSGKLPKAALKDYAVMRWAFQAHANPAMMLSRAQGANANVEQVTHCNSIRPEPAAHARWC